MTERDAALILKATTDPRYLKYVSAAGLKEAGLTPPPAPPPGAKSAGAIRTPLGVLKVCRWGGTDADVIEECPSCKAGAKHVRECEKHKKCTWEPVSPGVMSCRQCQSAGLGWAAPLPQKAHALAWLAEREPELKGGGGGDGVVVVGAGKYWPGAAVAVKMLRDRRAGNSRLSVEVWYRGSVEPIEPAAVAGIEGVTLIDVETLPEWTSLPKLDGAEGIIGNPHTDKNGWLVKAVALANTRFDRVLYLDADAYPVSDPAPLFDLATAKGMVYWEDLEDHGPKWWPKVWPDGPRTTVPIQGGHLVIDRRVNARELVLAAAMNREARHYYALVHGDQDVWRVALAVTGGPHCRVGPADWTRDVAFVPKLDGRPMFVHRVRSKLGRVGDFVPEKGEAHNKPHYDLPLEHVAFTHLAEVLRADRDAASVFTRVYRSGVWGEGSGAGSATREARPFADWLNAEAGRRAWRSVVDAGCGDGRVARLLNVEHYTGMDCVEGLLPVLRDSMPDRTWEAGDVRDVDALPAGDVLVSRDVLHHWPTEDVERWIRDVGRAGKWKWLVVAVDEENAREATDCPMGTYRPLSPDLAPLKQFGFAVALRYQHKVVMSLKLSPGV